MVIFLAESSPRMRGAQRLECGQQSERWIIPAYAGSTFCWAGWLMTILDHPRVCGEHVSYDSMPVFEEGSSPRMRGALSVQTDLAYSQRIIPEYAGSTLLLP